MEKYSWYTHLIKPTWAPPGWLFSPVWMFLYALIAISFATVLWMTAKKKVPCVVALPFVLNLIFNFAFVPIHFTLKNNLLASIDVILVLVTLLWAMRAIYPYARWISFMQIPYLLWTSFAAALQLSITHLNW